MLGSSLTFGMTGLYWVITVIPSPHTNLHTKQYDIICKSQILSYLQRPVTTSGDSSLALGMTWQLGGYGGRSGDSRKLLLSQQFTCESPLLPPMLLKGIVIPSGSEGSPSLIT